MRFFKWNIQTHPKNRSPQVQIIPDREQRRRQLRNHVDRGGFQKLVVFSAGMGFLAGAYEIFATSLTMPLIKLVYYYPDRRMPAEQETLLRCATLIGAMIGQLSFGFLADIYGRRKMYGFELYVMIIAIVGIVMSSEGAHDSMNIFGWLFTWRLIMGIGIGADYPLSATITAEFAPTRHRARMLACVFYMQPVGYLLATLITLAVTREHKLQIPVDLSTVICDEVCIKAVDRSWRIIIGVGAIPAVIALFFRRSVPESPLYTADVLNQPYRAIEDMERMNGPSEVELGLTGLTAPPPVESQQLPQVYITHPILFSLKLEDEDEVEKFGPRWTAYWKSFHNHFIIKGYWRSLFGTSLAWCLLDCSFYALGSSSSTVVTSIFNAIPIGGDLTDCVPGFPQNCKIGDPNHQNPYAQSLYGALFANAWRSLVVVCAGALSGGAGMIILIKSHSPRVLQITGFLLLIPIFLATGLFLLKLSGDQVTTSTAIMYFLAQLVFEIGPNFTTFILPAEIFPTRHRAFAHGIAAASGKLGASIFQIFFQLVQFHNEGKTYTSASKGTKWLGFTVLCFIPTMMAGALVSWLFVPETRLGESRKNQPLDELELLGSEAIFSR